MADSNPRSGTRFRAPGFGSGRVRPGNHFQSNKGASNATLEGQIKGRESVDYVLGAREGHFMNVSMTTDNTSNYFNIIPPGKADEALFVGSIAGNQFDGILPASGDYKIRVYPMRNATPGRHGEIAPRDDHR